MTKTMLDKLCDDGIHDELEFIGNQEFKKESLPLGNCYNCGSTRVITKAYERIGEVRYKLKNTGKELYAKECRE